MSITTKVTSVVKDQGKYIAYVQILNDGAIIKKVECPYDPDDDTIFTAKIDTVLEGIMRVKDELDTVKSNIDILLSTTVQAKVDIIEAEKLASRTIIEEVQ